MLVLTFYLLSNLNSRTVKDIVTFIPVVIILIIPMTPVGHVLVFGAIQRFFPDFFPSCFTEQRQNLLQLYETTEFSEVTIKESFQVSVVLNYKLFFPARLSSQLVLPMFVLSLSLTHKSISRNG